LHDVHRILPVELQKEQFMAVVSSIQRPRPWHQLQ